MKSLLVLVAVLVVTMVLKPARAQEVEEMLPLLQRHEIQVLLSAGMPMQKIADRLQVSVDTVRRVGLEPAISHIDDSAERRARKVGRPSKASPYEDPVRRWLGEDPHLPTQELLRRAKDSGYRGAKSAFYDLVAGVRPRHVSPVVRFEGLPGEFSQHDFGQVDVRFVDGTVRRVHFFASRLKFSRFAAVSIVPDETTETLLRTLVRHFDAFGGVPLLAVFDRPRTVVKKSGKGREVQEFNATFAQVMLDLAVGVEMCAARSGNQKGAVEHLVKWVKNSFFKWRKFVDDEDLHAQLVAWVEEVNHKTPNRATGELPEVRRRQELARLRPLRIAPRSLALRVPVFVGPTAEVYFEGRSYSMPPKAAHRPATAFVYEDRIRFVVADNLEATHARGPASAPPSSLPEHRAQKLAEIHGARAVQYEKREQLLRLGADALRLLTELVHRSPRQAIEDVAMLHALYQEHGHDATCRAITAAVHRGTYTVEAVHAQLSPEDAERTRAQLQRSIEQDAERRARAAPTRPWNGGSEGTR